MDGWQRIGDHEPAQFGRHDPSFAEAGGTYRLHVSDEDPRNVTFERPTGWKTWPIWLIERRDECWRLSGTADDPAGTLFARGAWFELTLGRPATVAYYGDRVLLLEHTETTA